MSTMDPPQPRQLQKLTVECFQSNVMLDSFLDTSEVESQGCLLRLWRRLRGRPRYCKKCGNYRCSHHHRHRYNWTPFFLAAFLAFIYITSLFIFIMLNMEKLEKSGHILNLFIQPHVDGNTTSCSLHDISENRSFALNNFNKTLDNEVEVVNYGNYSIFNNDSSKYKEIFNKTKEPIIITNVNRSENEIKYLIRRRRFLINLDEYKRKVRQTSEELMKKVTNLAECINKIEDFNSISENLQKQMMAEMSIEAKIFKDRVINEMFKRCEALLDSNKSKGYTECSAPIRGAGSSGYDMKDYSIDCRSNSCGMSGPIIAGSMGPIDSNIPRNKNPSLYNIESTKVINIPPSTRPDFKSVVKAGESIKTSQQLTYSLPPQTGQPVCYYIPKSNSYGELDSRSELQLVCRSVPSTNQFLPSHQISPQHLVESYHPSHNVPPQQNICNQCVLNSSPKVRDSTNSQEHHRPMIHVPTAMSSVNPYLPTLGMWPSVLPSPTGNLKSQNRPDFFHNGLQYPTSFSSQNVPNYGMNLPQNSYHQVEPLYINSLDGIRKHHPSQQQLFCNIIPPQTVQFPPVIGVSETRHSKEEKSSQESSPSFNYGNLLNGSVSADPRMAKDQDCSDKFPCLSGGCVPYSAICNNKVDCRDASDEMHCSCRDRVDKDRICDGYFDCPYGEDELGCFGCSEKSFSCGNWFDHGLATTCVPLEKRCDDVHDCPNGKDEKECSVLANSVSNNDLFVVSYMTGYLHHNWRGVWYPACPDPANRESEWARSACTAEIGHDDLKPHIDIISFKTPDRSVFLVPRGKRLEISDGCGGLGLAAYVTCSDISCGTRINDEEETTDDFERSRQNRFILSDDYTPHLNTSNESKSRISREDTFVWPNKFATRHNLDENQRSEITQTYYLNNKLSSKAVFDMFFQDENEELSDKSDSMATQSSHKTDDLSDRLPSNILHSTKGKSNPTSNFESNDIAEHSNNSVNLVMNGLNMNQSEPSDKILSNSRSKTKENSNEDNDDDDDDDFIETHLIAGKDSLFTTIFHPELPLSFSEDLRRMQREDIGRVVGGKNSKPARWPWIVALYQDGSFHCGGVIIHHLWVMTAAHCVDNYSQHYYEIQAGILRRFSFSPMEQTRTVHNVVLHEKYVRTVMQNDLALLFLDRPLQYNRWVRPICLPYKLPPLFPPPGTICTAVGWGATVEHGPDPDHMREVQVPILPTCKHQPDREGAELCAGALEGGRDTCQGDSGGPLLCRHRSEEDAWFVVGVVSHGEGCARPFEPGAYTRVALFLDWINEKIAVKHVQATRPLLECPGHMCHGSFHCIPSKMKCNGKVECLHADDEIGCTYDSDFFQSLNPSLATKYSKKSVTESESFLKYRSNNNSKIELINFTESTNPSTDVQSLEQTDVTETYFDENSSDSQSFVFIGDKQITPSGSNFSLNSSNYIKENDSESSNESYFYDMIDDSINWPKNVKNNTDVDEYYEDFKTYDEEEKSVPVVNSFSSLQHPSNISGTESQSESYAPELFNDSFTNMDDFNTEEYRQDFHETDNRFSTNEQDIIQFDDDNNDLALQNNYKSFDSEDQKSNKSILNESLVVFKTSDIDSPGTPVPINESLVQNRDVIDSYELTSENPLVVVNYNQSHNVLNNDASDFKNHTISPDFFETPVLDEKSGFYDSQQNFYSDFDETITPKIHSFIENIEKGCIISKKFDLFISNNIIHNSTHESIYNLIDQAENRYKYNDKIKNIINLKPSYFKKLGLSKCWRNQNNFKAASKKLTHGNNSYILQSSENNLQEEIPIWLFRCKMFHQFVPFYMKCDGKFDCEDGSDESNCTCWDIILAREDNLICDGVVDCPDKSDEENCFYVNCPDKNIFPPPYNLGCSKLKRNISTRILSNGKYIRYDEGNQLTFSDEGVVTEYIDNHWLPFCTSNASYVKIAVQVCNELFYANYDMLKPVEVSKQIIPVIKMGEDIPLSSTEVKEKCTGLEVRCTGLTDITGNPWHAIIFLEGQIIASAALVTPKLLLTDCIPFKNIDPRLQYVSASLGNGRLMKISQLSLYEQNIRVNYIYCASSGFAALQLMHSAQLSHYVKPLGIMFPWFLNDFTSRCITLEYASVISPTPVELELLSLSSLKLSEINYDDDNDSDYNSDGYVSYGEHDHASKTSVFKVKKSPEQCLGADEKPQTGVIVCESANGWYAVGTYHLNESLCDFNGKVYSSRSIEEFTNELMTIERKLVDETNKINQIDLSPDCDAWRCPRGRCLRWADVANGLADCEDGSDETDAQKKRKLQFCSSNVSVCDCAQDELRCLSGECISKQRYCDGKQDCYDGSDEQVSCRSNCTAYLELSSKNLLCNGQRNCLDKSDENWNYCGDSLCNSQNSFKCNSLGRCIPAEFVCDGESDCPDGEDELQCIAVKDSIFSRLEGIISQQKFGVWIPLCINAVPSKIELNEMCQAMGLSQCESSKVVTERRMVFNYDAFSSVTFGKSSEPLIFRNDYPLILPAPNNETCDAFYIKCI